MKRIRRKSGMEEKKRRVGEVESSEEEEGIEQMKVKLESCMIVLIDGEKHYMRDFLDQKNLIFSYPEGKLKGQYIEKTQKIEEIDHED